MSEPSSVPNLAPPPPPLAPCPFCGNCEVVLETQDDVYIGCPECGMRGPVSGAVEEAVWLWQTRAPA